MWTLGKVYLLKSSVTWMKLIKRTILQQSWILMMTLLSLWRSLTPMLLFFIRVVEIPNKRWKMLRAFGLKPLNISIKMLRTNSFRILNKPRKILMRPRLSYMLETVKNKWYNKWLDNKEMEVLNEILNN